MRSLNMRGAALAACLILAGAAAAQTKPASSIPSWNELKYPPLKQVAIPDVEQFTLANGMRVYLLEDHELPLVSGFALVRTGNLFDPPEKVGLADVTGTVIRTGGTQDKSGDELDILLENIAASVESSIGENSGQVSFSTLKENTDEVLGVFRDVLTNPAFRQDKIDLIKSQMKSAISRRNDEASAIASREFASIVLGRDNPYGWRTEYATVDRIARDDAVAFYRRYFFPKNIMLAVYGDFSTAEMKAKLEKLLGSWNYEQPPVPPFPDVPRKASPGVYLGEKTDVNEAVFYVGHLGGILKDKNDPALEIMADILGGGFSSRLFRKIRTELGYAYGVGANWGAGYEQPGLFSISGSTKSAVIVDALKVVREEVERIRTTPVTDQELETAKQTVLNSFVFNFDTKSKTLSRLIRYEYFGYPKDFIFQYQKALGAVTKADVLRVAKQYVRPEDFTFIAVGNPKDFGAPLSALGLKVETIDLTIPSPEAPAAKKDAASLQKGRELLRKAQAALGGAEKLAAVRDFTAVASVELQAAGGALKARQTNRWLAPSHFRQDSELPFGKLTTYFDGKEGWIAGPQGTGPLPPPVLRQAADETGRLFFRLILSDRDPDRTVNYAGGGVVQIADKQGNVVNLEIDEATGLPLRQKYTATPVTGAPAEVEEAYDEWMEAGGVKVPRKITIRRGGQKTGEAVTEDLKVNTGLTVEQLSQKP